MRREFLNLFPTWAVVLTMAMLFIVAGLGMYLLAHRYCSRYLIKDNTHNMVAVFNLIGVSSILLAFTIVILWQFFMAAKDSVDQESTTLKEIILFSQGLSVPESHQINLAVKQYTTLVINDEWSKMSSGQFSDNASSALYNLYYTILNYSPVNSKESIIYQEILRKYDDVLRARDIRLGAIESIIPGYFFNILIVNLLLLVLAVCLLDEGKVKTPILLVVIIATICGLNLGLTFSLDYPFSGEFPINNAPFVEILSMPGISSGT